MYQVYRHPYIHADTISVVFSDTSRVYKLIPRQSDCSRSTIRKLMLFSAALPALAVFSVSLKHLSTLVITMLHCPY